MSHPRKDLEIFGKALTIKIMERIGSVFVGESRGSAAYIIGMPKNAIGTFGGKCCAVIARGNEELPVIVPSDLYGNDICFECNIRHLLGGLIEENDILYTKFEKTGGAVMFTEQDGERKFLLIKNESGHIGFPKGHIEYDESETDTAAREVKEETGLDFVQYGDFREEYTYSTKENCIKTGVFFIGHYEYREPEIQEEEILDDWLLPYGKALVKLNFPEDRELLRKAEKYISETEKNNG
ncbi:MAG: NUDIX domain-containing protein [Ruminiclostridium sp.]|nr:NUDIX domain-containing protein [Ruminiclostridium sp.]